MEPSNDAPVAVPDEPKADVVKRPPPSPTVMLAATVFAGILAIGLLVWVQGIRTASIQRQAFGRGIDGLAASLTIPVMDLQSVRFANRGERLQGMIESIQRRGDYESVVVTDASGTVLATTDTSLSGQVIKEFAEKGFKGGVKDVNGVTEAVAPIMAESGDRLGTLRVRARIQ